MISVNANNVLFLFSKHEEQSTFWKSTISIPF